MRPPFAAAPLLFAPLVWLAPLGAQESKALLHAPLAVLPVDSAPFQRLGDFDGDGDLDVVGTRLHENGSNSELRVWENVDGAFGSVFSLQRFLGGRVGGEQRSHAVATGDLNGDGRDDFVVVGSGAAYRYLSAPGWQFTETILPLSMPYAGSRAVAIGDFDGDGTADIAVAGDRYDSFASAFDVFFGNGAVLATTVPTAWRAGLSLQPIDFDGDGVLDLFYADKASQTAYVYTLLGGVMVQQQALTTTLNYNGGTPWLWMAGDLDGDLDVDVVCFKPELGTNGVPRYQLFRRTGATTLVAEAQAIGGPVEYLADIDGDGDLDGVCCGGGQPSYDWPKLDFASTFELSENRGGGDFARAWAFPNAGSESMAGAADVDGDGDVDLVAGRSVFYGDGPWNAQPMPVAGGTDITRILLADDLHDVDGDGDIDVELWADNDGTGACKSKSRPLAPPPGHQLSLPFAIDVDGDGVRDRVSQLYQTSLPPTFVGMAWERNNGGGNFSYGGPCGAPGMLIGPASGWSLNKLRRADLDGDGDEDCFVEGGRIHWNQNGTFSAAQPPLPNGLYLDLCADLDGDGLPELVTSGYLGQLAQVWRGTGAGGASGFVAAVQLGNLPYEPGAAAAGDLDGDGDVDFLRPDAAGTPVLFVNVTPPGGPLAFDAHPLTGIAVELTDTSAFPSSLVRPTASIVDFDQDGRNDILLGRLLGEANTGAVLRRVSWSSPPSLADYEVVRLTFVDGYAADVDGDLLPDVMGTLSVRNRHLSRAAAGRRVQRELGVPGEAGAVPLLGATGPFRVGETEVLRLSNVPGPTVAVLGLSLGEDRLLNTPLLGLILYLDLSTTIIGSWAITEDGEGIAAARASLPIVLPNGLQGWTFYTQAFVLDAAAWNGVTQSQLLVKTIGG